MFSPEDRERLLADLVARARAEDSVTGAAVVGSGARGQTDRWSDIDLALCLSPSVTPQQAAEAWSGYLGSVREVAHTLDLWSGTTLYRVNLLADSLQVDLSFWPAETFASNGEPFALLFGQAGASAAPAPPDPENAVGWGWLYALHTRSALARGRPWQAVQMLNGLRDQVVALACLRYGLPWALGRGVDGLPRGTRTALTGTLPASPEPASLIPAFAAAVELLRAEAAQLDPALATRLAAPLSALTESICQAAG